MHHVYMSVAKVLDPAGRPAYTPEAYYHNYRGYVSDYKSFKYNMERAGHNVITSKERFNFEAMGGPRKVAGVYVDQSLSPRPKSEVYP